MSFQQTLCISILAIGLITLVVLLIVSFSSLEVNEVGLDYSGISKSIDPAIFTPGIHFLGVGHHFIKFPSVVQTLEFSHESGANAPSIKSRTQDGLEVIIEVSFQYSLQINKLYHLYNKYGEDYRIAFQNIAIDVLTDAATNHTADEFFNDRLGISQAMLVSLNNTYNLSCDAVVEYFQLRSVDLPDKYEAAIQYTEVKKQDILKAQAEQQKNLIEIQTLVLQATMAQQIVINQARASADALLQQNNADIQALNYTLGSNAFAYGRLKTALGLDNEGLLAYMKAQILKEYPASNMIVGLQ